MRLGAPLPQKYADPEAWTAALQALGYRAAYCPVEHNASRETIGAFAAAARRADIVIAEVGAWSNPLSADETERKRAIDLCQKQLALADEIGARCCVNITGSRGTRWDGPHPDNLTPATFDLIVETIRGIIDAVKPKRTFWTIETMPWMYPDSLPTYLQLLDAIDRGHCAVHFDPANWINSPQRYFGNATLIRESVRALGPRIKSVHVKDIALGDTLMVHLEEVRPGLGALDHATLLRELALLDANLPVMLEHLPNPDEYALAAAHIRKVAGEVGVTL
jgi:sugar phosphate isomerase/epimerase